MDFRRDHLETPPKIVLPRAKPGPDARLPAKPSGELAPAEGPCRGTVVEARDLPLPSQRRKLAQRLLDHERRCQVRVPAAKSPQGGQSKEEVSQRAREDQGEPLA